MIGIERIVKVAKEASLLGGLVLRENFKKVDQCGIQEKAEKDIVSYVDRTSEDIIRDYILKNFPDHDIVGEERGGKAEGDYVWYVDPLDGTKNYISGFPIFGTSVGVTYKGEPVAGAVYLPYFNTLYWAGKGLGAWKDGTQIHVSDNDQLKRCSVAYGFPSRANRDLDIYWNVFKSIFDKVGSMRRPGAAAVDLCFLAEGIFDGVVEFELNPWDVCAGIIIVKEAGGLVDLTNGLKKATDIISATPYLYPFLEKLVNSHLKGVITK